MDRRTVTTLGSGTASSLPDAVAVVLTLEVEGATPAEALRECGVVQGAVVAALGVVASAGGLSVQPGWDHERQREGRPRALSTVSARLPDLGVAGAVVTAALDAGGRAARLHSLAPVVSDASAALTSARQRAFDDSYRSAAQYAGLAGGRLGPLLTLSEAGGTGGSMRLAGSAVMDASYEVANGPQDVSVSVVATWELLAD